MKKLLLSGAASFAAMAMAGPADAATLIFDLSGGRNAIFQLDSNPTPASSQSFSFGSQAVFSAVPGTVNGMNATFGTISFGTGVFADLSITAPGLGFTQFSGGGPLFTGPASAPIFSPGTFQLTNNFFPDQNSTLTISQLASAVPEPTTWAMMLIGFGAVGFAMRRRKVRTTISYA